MKSFILTIFLITISQVSFCQEEKETNRVDAEISIKNMHFWRGFAVTTAPLIASDLHYKSPNGLWRFGFWSGMSFNGDYREFDYYVSFQKGPFSAAIWDIYNFSTPEITGRGFFDYNNRTTGRFVDLTLAYDFYSSLPLKISASTIIHGRDSEQQTVRIDPFFERTGQLRYTTYLEARYTILQGDSFKLQGFIGGSLALSGATENFYASRQGVNFVGFQYHKTAVISNYEFPIIITPAYNPNAKHAFMEVAIRLF